MGLAGDRILVDDDNKRIVGEKIAMVCSLATKYGMEMRDRKSKQREILIANQTFFSIAPAFINHKKKLHLSSPEHISYSYQMFLTFEIPPVKP